MKHTTNKQTYTMTDVHTFIKNVPNTQDTLLSALVLGEH